MPRSEPVDGFQLGYDRSGSGEPVVLLHGWPGDRTDYRVLAPDLAASFNVVVPDLRGFGESDKHPADPAEQYSAAAQARSVLGLIRELGLERPILAGYDIGSRIAQTVAQQHPDQVRALVIAPPLPGIGKRILDPEPQREFWYQAFHRLPLAADLIDGAPGAVRAYLSHFWSHWSGPSFTPSPADLDHLAAAYGMPGAFTASIAWYRSGAGSVARSLAEAGARAGRPDRRPGHRAVAGVRPAVPARLGGPGRGVLQRHHHPFHRRRRPFRPAGVPWRVRRRDPRRPAGWCGTRRRVRVKEMVCGALSGLPS